MKRRENFVKSLLNRASTRTGMLLVLLMTGGVACACQVPVFRYALERWEPDHYQLYVLSDGPLDATVREQWASIQNSAGGKAKNLAPVDWKFADVNRVRDPRLRQAWEAWPNKEIPMLAVFYPPGSDAPDLTPAYTAPADKKNIEAIMNSPARTAVLDRLTQGHSAVWIFVPSGHKDQDKAGYETLQQQLKLDAEWLELPSPEELEIAPEVLTNTKIKLQIGFSIVKLDPHDEAEKFLVEALLNSEPDLKSFDAPLAFPVFGRGRVLYGLVEKESRRTQSDLLLLLWLVPAPAR